MPPLYVVQQNSKLRLNNRRVQVEQETDDGIQVLAQIPIGQVSEIVLFGNVGLTTPLMDALLYEGIPVIFLTRDGDYRGILSGGLTPHVPLRRAQYRALEKPSFSLEMAKGFVRAKLRHQRTLLQRQNRPSKQDACLSEVIERMEHAIEEVQRKTSLSSLRGLEGSATAAYFSGLRQLFNSEWKFDARLRRPPPDPVNVLLSLGYTLLAQDCAAAVQAVGLDPYAGFLHEVAYNRPALGLDLLEEFRPLVDGVVLWICHSGKICPQQFTPGPPERPVVLDDQGKRDFIKAFEERMDSRFTHPLAQQQLTMRQCLIEQARQIARRILEDRPGYDDMGFR